MRYLLTRGIGVQVAEANTPLEAATAFFQALEARQPSTLDGNTAVAVRQPGETEYSIYVDERRQGLHTVRFHQTLPVEPHLVNYDPER